MRGARRAPPLEAVVLDFDGLVVDTESLHYESWRAEAELVGRTLDERSFARVVGVDLTDDEAVRLLLGPEFSMRAGAIAASARRRREQGRQSVGPVPGAIELIRNVRDSGLALGLATSSPSERVLEPLRRLGLLAQFHAVCCREEVGVSKPAPDAYRAVLKKLGVNAERAVALEDSGNGARAALAAGLRCVGVPRGVTMSHDFSGCDVVVAGLVGMTAHTLAQALGMSLAPGWRRNARSPGGRHQSG